MNSLAVMAQELSKFVLIYTQLLQMEIALDQLVHGKLSPSLVTPEQIGHLIDNIAEKFEGTSKRLCHGTPQHIYETKNIRTYRHGRDILLQIRSPIHNVRTDYFIVIC
jgi:hypothetical protein